MFDVKVSVILSELLDPVGLASVASKIKGCTTRLLHKKSNAIGTFAETSWIRQQSGRSLVASHSSNFVAVRVAVQKLNLITFHAS